MLWQNRMLPVELSFRYAGRDRFDPVALDPRPRYKNRQFDVPWRLQPSHVLGIDSLLVITSSRALNRLAKVDQ